MNRTRKALGLDKDVTPKSSVPEFSPTREVDPWKHIMRGTRAKVTKI